MASDQDWRARWIPKLDSISERAATDIQNQYYKGEYKENNCANEARSHDWRKERWDQSWQGDDRWDHGWKNEWKDSKKLAEVSLAPAQAEWVNWRNQRGDHAENRNVYSYGRWSDAEHHCRQVPLTGNGGQTQPPTTPHVDAQDQASSASPPKVEFGQGGTPDHPASLVLPPVLQSTQCETPAQVPTYVPVLDSKSQYYNVFNAATGLVQQTEVWTTYSSAPHITECDVWKWLPEEVPQTKQKQSPQQQGQDSQQYEIKLLHSLFQ